MNSGNFIIIVIEKMIYSLEVTYHTHQIALLTFMTNQKNIFGEEPKAQLLDKSVFPGYPSVCYVQELQGKEAFMLSIMLLRRKFMTRC